MNKDKVKAALDATLYASKYGPTRRSRLAWVLRQAGLGLDEANTFIRDAITARVLAEIGFAWVLMTPMGVELVRDFDNLSQQYDWPASSAEPAKPGDGGPLTTEVARG